MDVRSKYSYETGRYSHVDLLFNIAVPGSGFSVQGYFGVDGNLEP
jgi:hypothetical protein